MVMYQTVFKRYELKYMITSEQKKAILQAAEPYFKQVFLDLRSR